MRAYKGYQFSWVIKWLFLYQALVSLGHRLTALGQTDEDYDAESFQYDPSWVYHFIFLLSRFDSGTVAAILKTALGNYDPAVVPDALTECPESPITEEKIEPESTYDQGGRHYHFRARAYDPFMGRFLQTDPMGYADSMNLYQAFNMNPFNFTDPMGEETYRVFCGFGQNDRGTNPQDNSAIDFPNFNNLARLAGPGDTFEFIPIGDPRYNIQSIQNSLNANDTQTYFIGHGARGRGTQQHVTFALDISPNNRVFFPINPVISQNSRVGLFTCGSSQYARTLVDGQPELVSVDSGVSNTSSTNALAESGYNYIRNRMRLDNPVTNQDRRITEQIIENRANQPFVNSTYSTTDRTTGQPYRIDQGDHVQIEPTQMQIQAIRTVGILFGLFRI